MPQQRLLQQLQAGPLALNELQVRWLGQVREIGMALGSQVQLLRSGDKGKAAFRQETTSALPCSTTANHSRRTGLGGPEGSMWGGQLALHSNISRHSPRARLLGMEHVLEQDPPAPSKAKGPPCCPPPQHRCCATWKVPLSPPVPPVQWVAVPTAGQSQ